MGKTKKPQGSTDLFDNLIALGLTPSQIAKLDLSEKPEVLEKLIESRVCLDYLTPYFTVKGLKGMYIEGNDTRLDVNDYIKGFLSSDYGEYALTTWIYANSLDDDATITVLKEAGVDLVGTMKHCGLYKRVELKLDTLLNAGININTALRHFKLKPFDYSMRELLEMGTKPEILVDYLAPKMKSEVRDFIDFIMNSDEEGVARLLYWNVASLEETRNLMIFIPAYFAYLKDHAK